MSQARGAKMVFKEFEQKTAAKESLTNGMARKV
jgi:hypothetical protein